MRLGDVVGDTEIGLAESAPPGGHSPELPQLSGSV
jgi:hypothetical protein